MSQEEEVSIVFEESHRELAQALADEFIQYGFKVLSGPRKLSKCETYPNITYYCARQNTLNIILASQELFRNGRKYFEEFSKSIKKRQSNIQVLSMDNRWLTIRSETIDPFKSIVFHELFDSSDTPENRTLLAQALVGRVQTNASQISHLNRSRILNFLDATHESVEVSHDANELKGQINFSMFSCAQGFSGQTTNYLVLFPRSSIERTKSYIEDHCPEILEADPTKTFVVRSKPTGELTPKQIEDAASILNIV